MRSKVDFPHPDGPTRITNAPSGIWIETSCRTGVAPNDFFTFSIDKDAISHFPHARNIERARAIIRQQFELSWSECDLRPPIASISKTHSRHSGAARARPNWRSSTALL